MKIYVASSWKNVFQPIVVEELRKIKGVEVYDFKNQRENFHWSWIDKDYENWSSKQFIKIMDNHYVVEAYEKDMYNLDTSDLVVLVLPCNRSAHLELGYAIGNGKKGVILALEEKCELEVMYKMVDKIFTSIPDLVDWIEKVKNKWVK